MSPQFFSIFLRWNINDDPERSKFELVTANSGKVYKARLLVNKEEEEEEEEEKGERRGGGGGGGKGFFS